MPFLSCLLETVCWPLSLLLSGTLRLLFLSSSLKVKVRRQRKRCKKSWLQFSTIFSSSFFPRWLCDFSFHWCRFSSFRGSKLASWLTLLIFTFFNASVDLTGFLCSLLVAAVSPLYMLYNFPAPGFIILPRKLIWNPEEFLLQRAILTIFNVRSYTKLR